MKASHLDGAGVVATWGGAGIGAAPVRRFARDGAGVVVNDLDPAAALAVADEVGAFAAPTDASTPQGALALVRRARYRLGEIDLFCANAGVAPAGGLDASDADWEAAFRVNVMGHARAARALLPGWLARGRDISTPRCRRPACSRCSVRRCTR